MSLFDGILIVQEWRNGSWGDDQPSDLRIVQSKSEGTTTLSVRTKLPDFLNLLHDFPWFVVVGFYSIWFVSSTFYIIILAGKLSVEITFATFLINKAIFKDEIRIPQTLSPDYTLLFLEAVAHLCQRL